MPVPTAIEPGLNAILAGLAGGGQPMGQTAALPSPVATPGMNTQMPAQPMVPGSGLVSGAPTGQGPMQPDITAIIIEALIRGGAFNQGVVGNATGA